MNTNTEPRIQDTPSQGLPTTTTPHEISPRREDAVQISAECCVICLGGLTAPCEAQPCGHSNFDYLCLITWLEFRPTCPLCQSNVLQVKYDLDQPGGQPKIYQIPEPSSLSRSPDDTGNITSSSESRETDAAVRWRRSVYEQNLYALHVGINRRQPGQSQNRELSPQLFMTDPELVSRARMWLCRELRVFQFLYTDVDHPRDLDLTRPYRPSKAEYLREYIIAILKSVDLQDHTGQAEQIIQRFLGQDYTRHLLHELRAWLRSPCKTLEEWDRAVQYNVDALPRDLPNTPARAAQPEPRVTKR